MAGKSRIDVCKNGGKGKLGRKAKGNSSTNVQTAERIYRTIHMALAMRNKHLGSLLGSKNDKDAVIISQFLAITIVLDFAVPVSLL